MKSEDFIKRWKPFRYGKKLFYIIDLKRYSYAKDIEHCESRFIHHKNIVQMDFLSTLIYVVFGKC